MEWFSVFLTANMLGIASNLDNCGVGIAYGTKKIKLPYWVNGIVNAIGFCMALIGAYAGETVARYITMTQASWAACIVLVCIGLFFWYSAYIHPRIPRKHKRMLNHSQGWKQGVILGFALSFTNVAVDFGATLANAATLWAAAVGIAVWGYIMIWLGNVVGIGLLSRLLGKYASFAAGLLLILIGVHQVFG